MPISNKRRHVIVSLTAILMLALSAALVAPSPAQASIVPGTHRCAATPSTDGYRGVACADLDKTELSMWAQGQALCQITASETQVQCAGIKIYVNVYKDDDNGNDQIGPTRIEFCGRFTNPWHNPACPSSSRFQFLALPVNLTCNDTYRAQVFAEFYLPSSGDFTSVSVDSFNYTYTNPGCNPSPNRSD